MLHNFVEDFHHPFIASTLQYTSIEMDILREKKDLSNAIPKVPCGAPLSATHDRRPIKFIKWKQDWKSELKDAD